MGDTKQHSKGAIMRKEHPADIALQALRKEFVLVKKRRVISWHAWLVAGIVVGIIVGVLWIANRTNTYG